MEHGESLSNQSIFRVPMLGEHYPLPQKHGIYWPKEPFSRRVMLVPNANGRRVYGESIVDIGIGCGG
jgi:hypothetical protein